MYEAAHASMVSAGKPTLASCTGCSFTPATVHLGQTGWICLTHTTRKSTAGSSSISPLRRRTTRTETALFFSASALRERGKKVARIADVERGCPLGEEAPARVEPRNFHGNAKRLAPLAALQPRDQLGFENK